MAIHFEAFSRVEDFDRNVWNRLAAGASPLMDWEYLAALEQSGAVSAASGYRPFHLVAYSEGEPVVIAPLYRRDRAWVEFGDGGLLEFLSEMTGIAYREGLLGALPLTPVPGYQFLYGTEVELSEAYRMMLQYIDFVCQSRGLATSRLYFLSESSPTLRSLLLDMGYMAIGSKYYLWFNRGFGSFDDYLATFKSSRRTKIKRELRTIRQQGITIGMVSGEEAPADFFEEMHRLYVRTWIKHMGPEIRPFLNASFFQILEKNFRHRCSFSVATREGKKLAMALFYEKGGHLYGRYWGCFREIPFLHFATCYYHPIAYAIEKGLAVMDPGFGGEHKLIRGYEVVPIYHYIKFHGKKEHDIAEAIMKKLRVHYALPFERIQEA